MVQSLQNRKMVKNFVASTRGNLLGGLTVFLLWLFGGRNNPVPVSVIHGTAWGSPWNLTLLFA